MWNVNLAIVHHIRLAAVDSRRHCFFFPFFSCNTKKERKNIRDVLGCVSHRKIQIIDNTFNVVLFFPPDSSFETRNEAKQRRGRGEEKTASLIVQTVHVIFQSSQATVCAAMMNIYRLGSSRSMGHMCVWVGVSAKSIKLSTRIQRSSETKRKKKQQQQKIERTHRHQSHSHRSGGQWISNWKNEEATHRKQSKKCEKRNNKKKAKMKRTILFQWFATRTADTHAVWVPTVASSHRLSGDTISPLIYAASTSERVCAKENRENNERERTIFRWR